MPPTNPAYPLEFRREAIRLVRASDEQHPIPGIAREIGISDGTHSHMKTELVGVPLRWQ